MKRLTVLYDERCGFCERCRRWLQNQEAFVRLEFVGARTPEATRRYPELKLGGEPEELVVVSDEGGVYRGASAWLMCLWALVQYRGWARRLAKPALRPLVRRACGLFSSHRFALSRVMGLATGEAEILRQIADEQEPACSDEELADDHATANGTAKTVRTGDFAACRGETEHDRA